MHSMRWTCRVRFCNCDKRLFNEYLFRTVDFARAVIWGEGVPESGIRTRLSRCAVSPNGHLSPLARWLDDTFRIPSLFFFQTND